MKLKLRHVQANSGEDISAILEFENIQGLINKLEEMGVFSISARGGKDGSVIGRTNDDIYIQDISLEILNLQTVYRPNTNDVLKTQATLRRLAA